MTFGTAATLMGARRWPGENGDNILSVGWTRCQPAFVSAPVREFDSRGVPISERVA